ncbi:MAG TPA: 50S ribosomal protein L4 [Desulfobacterales bacterium]|nr:50S ribosomal protein L4 [Desulfobacterales bacterium]
MAVVDVVNIKKEKVGEVELADAVFGVEVKPGILHEIVRMQRAKRRAGTACTKTRSEVRGSNAKPWRQKGTGRARAGSKRSPLWRGGGTVFGPKPRSYAFKVPKKVRRLGVRMALSARLAENNLTVVDDMGLEEIKTKKFVEAMQSLAIDNALIVIPERNEVVEKSCRNVPGYKVIVPEGLNVYDILLHRHLVLVQPAIDKIEQRLLA